MEDAIHEGSAMSVTIEDRIKAFPKELQDIVLEKYLKETMPTELIINESYKPPPQLQINSQSRQSNLGILYGSAKTTVAFSDVNILAKWAESLPSSLAGNKHCFFQEFKHYDQVQESWGSTDRGTFWYNLKRSNDKVNMQVDKLYYAIFCGVTVSSTFLPPNYKADEKEEVTIEEVTLELGWWSASPL